MGLKRDIYQLTVSIDEKGNYKVNPERTPGMGMQELIFTNGVLDWCMDGNRQAIRVLSMQQPAATPPVPTAPPEGFPPEPVQPPASVPAIAAVPDLPAAPPEA